MWYQKNDEREAEVFQIGPALYQYRIYLRHVGQYGTLVRGDEIARGYGSTLQAAKALVLGLMDNQKQPIQP